MVDVELTVNKPRYQESCQYFNISNIKVRISWIISFRSDLALPKVIVIIQLKTFEVLIMFAEEKVNPLSN